MAASVQEILRALALASQQNEAREYAYDSAFGPIAGAHFVGTILAHCGGNTREEAVAHRDEVLRARARAVRDALNQLDLGDAARRDS